MMVSLLALAATAQLQLQCDDALDFFALVGRQVLGAAEGHGRSSAGHLTRQRVPSASHQVEVVRVVALGERPEGPRRWLLHLIALEQAHIPARDVAARFDIPQREPALLAQRPQVGT